MILITVRQIIRAYSRVLLLSPFFIENEKKIIFYSRSLFLSESFADVLERGHLYFGFRAHLRLIFIVLVKNCFKIPEYKCLSTLAESAVLIVVSLH